MNELSDTVRQILWLSVLVSDFPSNMLLNEVKWSDLFSFVNLSL